MGLFTRKKKPSPTLCEREGHNWKMRHDGWQTNPKYDPTNLLGNGNVLRDAKGNYFTKKLIYYACKRQGCDAIAYNEPRKMSV